MKRLAPLAATLALLALPAGAREGSAAAPDKKVCRAAAAPLGSHIKRARVCRTAAEWAEIEAARRGPSVTTRAPQPEAWERTRPQ